MSEWIWKFGDFEKYHNMLVHSRRNNYGFPEPPVWKIFRPEAVVRFRKWIVTDGGKIHIEATGEFSTELIDDRINYCCTKLWGEKDPVLPAGQYYLIIRVMAYDTFPAVKVDGVVSTDESWEADDLTSHWDPVGTSPVINHTENRPECFPFVYTEVQPVSKKTKKLTDGTEGILLDYGKEIFAEVSLDGLPDKKVSVFYGESEEEALDAEWCYTRFRDIPSHGCLKYPPYAFRYLFVSYSEANIIVRTEMLKVENKAEFCCNDRIINQIWDVAAYTFHLNAREIILDGIKRDRWGWAADAYQSFFVNRYLFMDSDLERRTLIALGGGCPVTGYINTIMDYSYFWLISIWDYYVTYGDRKFIEQIYPQAKAHMDFCNKRRSEDGLIRGRKNDWVFIDWAEMDKDGALLGEQVLLSKALEAFGNMSDLLGYDSSSYLLDARTLRKKITDLYFDREQGAFIDCIDSGRRNVTRQNNLLAYLFLDLSDEIKNSIYENVILNSEIAPITTPYFKFYENQVICKHGDMVRFERGMREYYGKMLDLGATTLYEQFNPEEEGTEHFAMYGRPFEKSLCHAWSCSPIYLLDAYYMGVRNTGIAYSTFDVRPVLGKLCEFEGSIPLPKGSVRVKMNEKQVSVLTDAEGGTLVIKNERIPLIPGIEMNISY